MCQVEVTLTPVRLRSGPAMLVVWHDLTEQNRLAAQLRQSIARFDLMVEGASIGIWEVKLHQGRADIRPEDPVYWSPRFAQLLSFDGEAEVARHSFPVLCGALSRGRRC